MPNAHRLDLLRELREQAGLSQEEAARLCGLMGRQSRLTVGAWERGDYAPDERRRPKLIGYLWDHLRLRQEPQRFEQVWEILVEEWRWLPLSETEWQSLKPAARPSNGQAAVEVEPGHTQETRPAVRATGYRRSLDIALYRNAGIRYRPPVLFGRAQLLADLEEALTASGRVLLYGLGGAGKTAAAAAFAAQWIEQERGPVLWVQAGQADAETILNGLVEALDPASPAEIERWGADRSLLQTVERVVRAAGVTLLVFDDAWNGEALQRILRAVPAEVAALVTARLKFPRFTRLEVGDLAPHDAVALLGFYAGRREFRHDPEALQLCQALGGHAYALELAGSMLEVEPLLSPAQLRRQLAFAPHEVAMPADFAEAGQTSIKQLLDRSFQSLTPAQQQVFCAFGALFAPGASAGLVATLLDEAQWRTESTLRELSIRCLVRQNKPGFYELHDLTFSYVKSIVARSAPLRFHPIQTIQQYVAQPAVDIAQLELDQANIVSAAERARVQAPASLVAIIDTMASKGYFDARGYLPAILPLLDDAIAALRQASPLDGESLHRLLSKRGNAFVAVGDLEHAWQTYQQALACAPNTERQAMLLALLGKVSSRLGHTAEAVTFFDQAYALAEQHHDYESLCFTLEQQSHAAALREDFETVRQLAHKGLDLSMAYGHPTDTGYFLLNLGSAEFDLGVRRALARHQAALARAQEQDDEVLMAMVLEGLGIDYHALEHYEQARTHLLQARQLYQKLGQREREHKLSHLLRRFGYSSADSSASDLNNPRLEQ